jgi:hypothetical protein
MRTCLRELISEGQRRFAEIPLFIKRDFNDPGAWEAACRASWQALSDLHQTIVPDRAIFEEANKAIGDIAALEQRWRRPEAGAPGTTRACGFARLRIWFYRTILSDHLAGRLGRLAKRLLGRARARQWRLWMENWVFSGRSKA